MRLVIATRGCLCCGQVYKQVVILDMDGLGMGHAGPLHI
jgi:hypothetical protein